MADGGFGHGWRRPQYEESPSPMPAPTPRTRAARRLARYREGFLAAARVARLDELRGFAWGFALCVSWGFSWGPMVGFFLIGSLGLPRDGLR